MRGKRELSFAIVKAVSEDVAKQELDAVGIEFSGNAEQTSSGKTWKFKFAEKTTFLANKFKKVKLSDNVLAIYGIRPGEKTGVYNLHSTDILNKYGTLPIKSITLVRTPIAGFIDKGINMLSNNVWSELKTKYGYDVIYHLGMICEIGTKRVLIEKTDTPNISLSFMQDSTSEFFNLPFTRKDLSIIDMLDITRDAIGDDKFFIYDGFKQQNCQDFIHDILEENDILSNDTSRWIYQPMNKITGEIPLYVPIITRAITDIKKWIGIMCENPWLAFYKLISFILEICLIVYKGSQGMLKIHGDFNGNLETSNSISSKN